MIDNEFEKVFADLKVYEKLCDTVRFVDPKNNKVISHINNTMNMVDADCFAFWGKGKRCDNCISMRAYKENETFVKIEYNEKKSYMMTSIPYDLPSRRIIIELIKDITKSMFFGTVGEKDKSYEEIYEMINSMNNLAMKDQLTGIYNRRYIEEKLPVDLINSTLLSQDLSIIMADIDFFKLVNDNYGHVAGDYTLKGFVETISNCIKRDSDWIARFGGEEFLICLPGADIERAKSIAESMRKSIEKKDFFYEENKFNITASFGIYSVKAKQGDSIENLIKYVDEKLYEAKSQGRNRIAF